MTGIVFHTMSALPELADSPAEADTLYRRFLDVLEAETR